MNSPLLCIFICGLNILLLNTFAVANNIEEKKLKISDNPTNPEPKIDSLEVFNPSKEEALEDSEKTTDLLEMFNPPGDGAPEDTEVGGTRNSDSCLPEEPSIRVLMPKNNYGLTLKKLPQIYLDLSQTSAKRVLVTFKDETGIYYETALLPIEVKKSRDLASFTLPNSVAPLEIGKNYQWFITVICDRYVKPSDPTFSSWVRRVEHTA